MIVGDYIGSVTRTLTAAGERWPYIVGGYSEWSKNRHPAANAFAFYGLIEETRRSTMLEF